MGGGVTTVDCEKQVRSWRLLRSLMQFLIPTCIIQQQRVTPCLQNTTITGTIFGFRRGKVSFCIQPNANSTDPILLLELALPITILAKEMRGGTLRIALESDARCCSSDRTLLSTPLWTMYCNGRKVGHAVKRTPSNSDLEALRLMCSVVVGTGVINYNNQVIMYLRGKFQRVRASSNVESFHFIDPDGDIHQELSIFFLAF
ncbi:hypothetical protein RJT34_03360 [Clitoria ternatea]|uniref:Protein MIZU-KUSSEI 1 n=1 Tax=Clitoria ternatea TaxID=43366 RepID=A0AAN9KIU3_CLITE